MNNASTPDGRGQHGPNDAEPFFPSEGSFNAVVPLSEIGHARAPLPTVDAADVGKPAEAAWAREAHRARSKEDEETLVPSRAGRRRGTRPPWLATAAVIALSVTAGLASGTYLIWSSHRAPLAAEAPTPPPAPVEADKNVEQVSEPVKDEKPDAVAKSEKPDEVAKPEKSDEVAKPEKSSEVAKAEKSDEVARAPKPEPPARTSNAPRAERPARAVAEPKEAAPAPKPTRTRSAPPARPRLTTAERQPAAPPARTLPVSSPPPSARSKKVIQWP